MKFPVFYIIHPTPVKKAILCGVLAILAGCSKQTIVRETPPETPAPTPTPAPVVKATPAPAPAPAPEPAPKRLAPQGVYYAIQRISVTTDEGIRSIAIGAGVKLVRENGPQLVLNDGKSDFTATRTQVTNDLDEAEKALRPVGAAAPPITPATAVPARPQPVAPVAAPISSQRADAQARFDSLLQQERALQTQIEQLRLAENRNYDAKVRGRDTGAATMVNARAPLEVKLKAVTAQKLRLRDEIDRLP